MTLMIRLTKLNGDTFFANPKYITKIECAPDTLITFATGEKLPVADTLEEVIGRIRGQDFPKERTAPPPYSV